MTEEIGKIGCPPSTDLDAALAMLRAIRDAESSTTTEKINAIKSIALLLGQQADDGRGPGMMTRDEIASELRRLKALTQG